MSRSIRLIAAMAATLCLSGCAQEFKDFAPAGAGFKVQLPGTPKEQVENASGLTIKLYVLEQRNGAYFCSATELPIPEGESDEKIQTRLDGSRDGMVGSSGAVLTNETKITLEGKYPGREIQADIPKAKGMLRARFYLVDRKLYQVQAVGTKEWAKSADVTKFLNSLVLTK
jgi:hypothetical protein